MVYIQYCSSSNWTLWDRQVVLNRVQGCVPLLFYVYTDQSMTTFVKSFLIVEFNGHVRNGRSISYAMLL